MIHKCHSLYFFSDFSGYAGIAVLAMLAVATAGLAHAVAGGVNYAINRQFFFTTTFKTNSINKILDLQKAADKLIATPLPLNPVYARL